MFGSTYAPQKRRSKTVGRRTFCRSTIHRLWLSQFLESNGTPSRLCPPCVSARRTRLSVLVFLPSFHSFWVYQASSAMYSLPQFTSGHTPNSRHFRDGSGRPHREGTGDLKRRETDASSSSTPSPGTSQHTESLALIAEKWKRKRKGDCLVARLCPTRRSCLPGNEGERRLWILAVRAQLLLIPYR